MVLLGGAVVGVVTLPDGAVVTLLVGTVVIVTLLDGVAVTLLTLVGGPPGEAEVVEVLAFEVLPASNAAIFSSNMVFSAMNRSRRSSAHACDLSRSSSLTFSSARNLSTSARSITASSSALASSNRCCSWQSLSFALSLLVDSLLRFFELRLQLGNSVSVFRHGSTRFRRRSCLSSNQRLTVLSLVE